MDIGRPDPGDAHGHREAERGDRTAAGPDKRYGVPQRAAGVEHEQAVADACSGGRERPERRIHDAPLDEARCSRHGEAAFWREGGLPFTGLVGRVGRQDDVARGLDAVDQRLIRLGSRRGVRAEVEASSRVGFGKVHVISNHFRGTAHEVIEQPRMHDPGPRPAACVRLKIAEGVLVDLDQRDIIARALRPRGVHKTPVVGSELDELEGAEPPARSGAEQCIDEENERGRTETNEETRNDLHAPIARRRIRPPS